MEAQLRHPGDEAEGVGPAVELAAARLLLLAQGEDDVLAQVRLAHLRLPVARLVARRDLGDGREPPAQRLLQPLDLLVAHDTGASGPERVHEGQARGLRPFEPEVQARYVGLRVERGIADEQRGVGRREHVVEGRAHGNVLRLLGQPLLEEDLDQRDARPARGVEGDAPYRAQRAVEIEADRAHGPAARDRDAGHDRVVAEGVLDRRDGAEVDFVPVEALGNARRDLLQQAEVGIVGEPVDDGRHVQIGDRPQTEHVATRCASTVAPRRAESSAHPYHPVPPLKTVSRSRGRRPASRMSRQSSWTVMDCAVWAPASWAIFSSVTVPSRSSAPKESPTWARRGPIMIQYDLMCGKLS